jgi:hypothetical protein
VPSAWERAASLGRVTLTDNPGLTGCLPPALEGALSDTIGRLCAGTGLQCEPCGGGGGGDSEY